MTIANKIKIKKVKEIFFCNNGNTAVFDEKGEQIPRLQVNWFLLFVSFLKDLNVKNIDEIIFNLPDLKKARYDKEYHGYDIK